MCAANFVMNLSPRYLLIVFAFEGDSTTIRVLFLADRIERRLADEEVTLAELLKADGYNTAAFIYNATQFDPVFGLNQGFDTYSIGEEADRKPSFAKTLPACLHWLEINRQKPFFIFLHSNDIHQPCRSHFF